MIKVELLLRYWGPELLIATKGIENTYMHGEKAPFSGETALVAYEGEHECFVMSLRHHSVRCLLKKRDRDDCLSSSIIVQFLHWTQLNQD